MLAGPARTIAARARLRPRAGEAGRSRGDRVADPRGARRATPTPAVFVEAAGGHRRSRAGRGAAARGPGARAGRSGAAGGAGAAAGARGAHRRGDRARRGVRRRGARGRRRPARAARQLRRRGAVERRAARRRRRSAPRRAARRSRSASRWRSAPRTAPRWRRSPRNHARRSGRAARSTLRRALRSFVGRRARPTTDLAVLGRLAAQRPAAARLPAPAPVRRPPPPAGQLAGLLTWTYDLFTAAPPLVGLAAAAGHAAEALDRPLLVAVMGEFNAGKSSFVNALRGAEVAPTGVTPTTATVNVLRYGAEPAARVVAPRRRDARRSPPRTWRAFSPRCAPTRRATIRMVEDLPAGRDAPPRRDRRHAGAQLDPPRARTRGARLPAGGRRDRLGVRDRPGGQGDREGGAGARARRGQARARRAQQGRSRRRRRRSTRSRATSARSLGDLVETIMPFSATRALAARRARRKPDAALRRARGGAGASASSRRRGRSSGRRRCSALRRLLAAARAAAAAQAAPVPPDFAAARARAGARWQAPARRARQRAGRAARAHGRGLPARGAGGARVRAPALVAVRRAPRDAADEAFLAELLEDAVTARRRAHARRAAARRCEPRHDAGGRAARERSIERHRSLRRLRPRRDRRRRRPRLLPPPAAPPAPRGRRHPRRARPPRPRSRAGAVRPAAPRPRRPVRRVDARPRRGRDGRRDARLVHAERLPRPLAALADALAVARARLKTASGASAHRR